MIIGFQESANVISKQDWPEIEAMEQMESFFIEQFAARLIPSESQPTNWTRFCENVLSMLMASDNTYSGEPRAAVENAIDALRPEIQILGYGTFPRSVSLLQVVLDALTKAGGGTAAAVHPGSYL